MFNNQPRPEVLVKSGTDLCLAAMAFLAFCKAIRLFRWFATPFVRCIDTMLEDDSVYDGLKMVIIIIILCYSTHVIVGIIAFYKELMA